MKVQTTNKDPNITLTDLQGDLDFNSSPEVRTELNKLVDSKAPVLLIDLKQVHYIDSSGLATFVELFQRMKKYGGRLILFNLRQPVRGVFEIAKLDTIFHLAESEQDALSKIA